MSQTDLNVANASGAAVRTDINAHLDALASQSSGATSPTTTFPNQWWLDTSTNILKQRDNANTAWVNVALKSGTGWIPYLNGVLIGTATTSVEGLVERSTSAENVTGTNDTVYPTVAGAKEMIDTHALDLEFVSTAAISLATTIVVTGLVAGYDYIIQLEAFTPTDDKQMLWMRWSDDDGISYEEGVADYSWAVQGHSDTTHTSATDMSDAQIRLTGGGVGDDAGTLGTIEITMVNPNASSEKTTARWHGHYTNNNAVMVANIGGASFLQGNDAVDAAQFLWSGGSTFAAQGDITVWRRKRS